MAYRNTFIAVADDCPRERSEAPPARGDRPTIARCEYEMLADAQYEHTQQDVLFGTWLRRQGLDGEPADEIRRLREKFFSKSRACLRSSPLAKRYGWGFRFDHEGRVALVPVDSGEYRRIVEGAEPSVEVLKAMRSSRR